MHVGYGLADLFSLVTTFTPLGPASPLCARIGIGGSLDKYLVCWRTDDPRNEVTKPEISELGVVLASIRHLLKITHTHIHAHVHI